tara:strand:- start:130 stop:1215 length:1086 start_codon:yes stop_codon:yes gene_type:complete
MSYTVNNTRGSVVSTVNNGTTASVGGITLIGKNFTGYGELIAEDFVKILENNANSNAPTGPLEGQLWWDTTNQSLKVYNSSTQWHPVTVHVGATYPHTATKGSLWFNTTTNQLNVNSDGTTNGYQQLATASESSSAEVIVLTATQVDDNASNNNGYNTTTKNSVEVIAQVLTKGDGTTKDVIQVWSPSHFSFANPNATGTVAQAIYDTFSANITVSSSTASTQGTLIRGANVQDSLISEGVSADTIGGKTADDIVNDSRKFTLKTASFTASAGNQIGVNTSSASVTVTLPGSPANGDIVTLFDSHHQWGGTYPCIVARNGNTIDGATSDITLNTTGQAIKLMYNGSGWRTFTISNGQAIYG